MPAEVLAGSLEGEETPVLVTVALPPTEDRSIADTWSAMGGELKPSLDVVITAPMNIDRLLAAGPPVLEEPRLRVVQSEPAEDARSGKGKRTSGKGIARLPAASASPDAVEGLADETMTAGGASAPGRRIQVRQMPRR